MITRISLLPFYLGSKYELAHHNILRSLGFVKQALSLEDEGIIGLSISRWKLRASQEASDVSIYLEHRGFGVLVDRLTTDMRLGNHEDVVRLLIQRKQFHEQVRQGTHPLASLVISLSDRVKSETGKGNRRSMGEGVPYVFTFYVDEDDDSVGASCRPQIELPPSLSGVDIETLQGILAISEPSIVGLGDTEIWALSEVETEGIKSLASRVSSLDASSRYIPPSVDLNNAIYCNATWSSLVIFGIDGEPGSTINTYELLEVKIQIAWVAAYLVRRWCERGHIQQDLINSAEVDEIRWQVIPLLREASRLSDAGMSTRHTEIFRELKRTSGLDQEIEAAEDTLRWSFEATERSERRHRRRYELAVELLLGVIAALQLATLISDVPLISLPRWAASLVLIAFASTLVLVVVRNRGW